MKLETRELVKRYGERKVVDGVSLDLECGEIVGLLGPNGAGKTTTFHMITGFIRPEQGTITLDGHDITRMPVYKRARLGLGYLSQEPSIFRKLSVEDNVRAILEMLGVPKAEQAARVEELLAKFDVGQLKKQRGGTLSGGEGRTGPRTRLTAFFPPAGRAVHRH